MFCSITPELRTGAAGCGGTAGAAGLGSLAHPAIKTTKATAQESERTFILNSFPNEWG
jgi:hypothetical protein